MRVYLDTCICIYVVERHATYATFVEAHLARHVADGMCYSPLVRMECLVKPYKTNDNTLLQLYEAFLSVHRGVHYSVNPFYVIDTAFYLKPKTNFDMRWAYYQLLTHNINGMDSGSAIPSTSREEFYRLPVLVPPLNEQEEIAQMLAALNDKIELNRKINCTLEQMAQALFKSWFVDFEPVKAKAAGRTP